MRQVERLGLIALGVLLVVVLSAWYNEQPKPAPQVPEIEYAGEVPLLPNVRPVLVLKGSDYDMGFQHATQLVQVFGKHYLEGAAKVKRGPQNIAVLRKSEGYIKKFTPWAIDYIKGMTDGCIASGINMTYDQMLGHFVSEKTSPPDEEGGGGDSDCSGWAAWGSTTKDGKMICGGSGDHEMHVGSKYQYRYEITLMLFPESNGYPYVFCPPSGGAGHPGMNNKGVVYVHHGTTGYRGRYLNPGADGTGEGVPRVLLLMHCLRFANSAEHAKDLAVSIPNPGGRQGGIWADVNGKALVIENRDNPQVIRRPGDYGEKDFLFATNNLFSDQLKDAYQPKPPHKVVFIPHAGYLGTEGSLGSIGRNLGLWNLFTNYQGKVDLEFAKMIWRFKGPSLPYDTIDEAVDDYEKSQARLWNAHVSQPGNSVVTVLQPDAGDKGLIHVSHGCPVRGNDSPTYQGGVIVRYKPTFTFFELQLAGKPNDVAKAAKTRARYDLWNAYQALCKLEYTDPRYARLDDILNDAAAEWQKGNFYLEEAAEATGNDATVGVAKGVRCFTRAQCFAREVSEIIKPAPKRPEDLGLRPWFGNWGTWATRGEN